MGVDESSIRTTGLKRRIILQTDMEQSSRSSKVSLKQSQSMDIETGKAGSRTWLVEEVHRHKEAMKPSDRKRKEILNMFRIGNFNDIDEASTVLPPQYRLKTAKVSSFLVVVSYHSYGMDMQRTNIIHPGSVILI